MALKKGFCTHCQGDEKLRIFDVNKEADICYCPHCMAEMQPKEAISNYRGLISHYLKKGSKAIFESTQYLIAYQTFAHIIDLDETIKVARFGRILSLVYLSTLRKSKISFACTLHRQEAPKLFHYQESANEYYHFLGLLMDALNDYETRLKRRVTSHGTVFYDLDCVILYLKRIDEIKKYKEFIASEADYFVETNKDMFREIVDNVNKTSLGYIDIYKAPYVTADGYTYIFQRFDNNGMPLVMIKDGRPMMELRHKKMELNPKDGKKSAIKDEIYLNNLTLSRLVTVSIPFAIILFALALAGAIISFFVKEQAFKVLILAAAAAVVLVSLVLFILHFAWKNRLKKKYYNGTNPFILK